MTWLSPGSGMPPGIPRPNGAFEGSRRNGTTPATRTFSDRSMSNASGLGLKFYLNRAKIHLKSGRLNAAGKDCRAVLAEAPEHPRALAMMTRIERKRGLWRRSIRALRRFVGSGRARLSISVYS